MKLSLSSGFSGVAYMRREKRGYTELLFQISLRSRKRLTVRAVFPKTNHITDIAQDERFRRNGTIQYPRSQAEGRYRQTAPLRRRP